jgi:hypothetical protein
MARVHVRAWGAAGEPDIAEIDPSKDRLEEIAGRYPSVSVSLLLHTVIRQQVDADAELYPQPQAP